MADTLNAVLKKINKQYGDRVATKGAQGLYVDGILSLGSPSYDFCLYGGLPESRVIELSGPEGSGKAQPLWSPVFTPNGYKKMGDIKLGDITIDGKGNLTKIIGVFDRGILPIYKVSFNDGTYTYCAGDHLWKVYNHSYGKKPSIEILTTDDLSSRNLHAGCWGYSIDIPIIDCWEDKDIKIDPYLLGALIGDGSLANNLGFTNQEHDIIDKVNILLGYYGLELVNYTSEAPYDYGIRQKNINNNPYIYEYNKIKYFSIEELRKVCGTEFSQVYKYINAINKNNKKDIYKYSKYKEIIKILPNPEFGKKKQFLDTIKELNLNCKSIDKHIPKNYLYSSIATRTKLLQGLFDTDGYIDKYGNISFSTSSKQLAKDTSFLCRSLGCRVTEKFNDSVFYISKGQRIPGSPCWTLYIKIPDSLQIATSLKHLNRLKCKSNKPTSRWWRSIVDIEYYSTEPCRCILVDSPEHTYLTDDLICTHNTSSAFMIAASYQRAEIERNPDNPRAIVFLDNEGTFDPVWANKFGYDSSEEASVPTVMIRPEGQSAEEIFDMALDMLKTGEVGLLIFDSIATLVPAQINEESMEKQQMGGIAKSLTRFANTAIGLLRKYKATLVAINQVRENIGGYGDPITTPGRIFCQA